MGNGDAVVIDLAAARMMARQQRMKANRMATCGVCVGGHDFGALNCSGRSAECPSMRKPSLSSTMFD
jgi:dienelactone hydrolase